MKKRIEIDELIPKWNRFKNSKIFYECEKYKNARKTVIPETKIIIESFYKGELSIKKFLKKMHQIKSKDLSLKNKKAVSLWGAIGFKGIGFLNILIKYSSDEEVGSLKEYLIDSIKLPQNISDAKNSIDNFKKWVSWLKSNINKEKVYRIDQSKNWKDVQMNIRPNYSIFLLSWFWDMQDYGKYPVYYTSSEKIFKMAVLNSKAYYNEADSAGENYVSYCNFINDLEDRIKKNNNGQKLSYPDISTELLYQIYKNKLL